MHLISHKTRSDQNGDQGKHIPAKKQKRNHSTSQYPTYEERTARRSNENKVEKRIPECEKLSVSDSKEREVAKMMLDNKNEQK